MREIPTAQTWLARARALQPEGRALIDGCLRGSAGSSTFGVVNPATGTEIGRAARCDAEDVDAAVRAARSAHDGRRWSRIPPRDRMAILVRLADLIEARAVELALLDTLCMGKPVGLSFGYDVGAAARTFRFFGECIDKIEGAVGATREDVLHYVLRQPFGVVGCIVPWNYPLMMAAWKAGAALAAGNCVVLKPAEQSPYSAVMLGELFLEAGGPAGVLNVVPGLGEEAGRALAMHGDVDKISFTGSVEVGRLMFVYSGQSNMKRVSVECGGKSPQIILDDVPDLTRAVDAAVHGIFGNQGEVCSAGSRILIARTMYEEFLARFVERADQLYRCGDPLDPATTLGPLVSRAHKRRVLDYVTSGCREGARMLRGPADGENMDHCFVPPTIFRDVRPGMVIARDEIFGPVAVLMPIDGPAHGLALANDSRLGLAASVWTANIGNAHRLARDLQAGVVWVNCYDDGDMTLRWGGFKQSGNGRDKCLEAVTQHGQTKSIWVDIGRSHPAGD